MFFNSIDFAIFFPIVFFLYWLVFRGHLNVRNVFLIAVSYLFYGWWDWRFLSLIIVSSFIDFLCGQQIFQTENSKPRKRWLALSVIVNLGFLGFFKYFNFFVDSFKEAFSLFGSDISGPSLNIILPVGISFYTFQTLSYTFDIYFKRLEPTKNIGSFFAFVSFFPQLVAGPIERARNLLPQFEKVHVADYQLIRSGLLLMAWGLFKKIVIADRLAIFIDEVYKNLGDASGLPAIIAVLFFALQLYLDFSAYSDIAIGGARTLGFKLSLNFNRPYLASSFGDFWKRWHISLSSWFKDYVYIPLGGNRNGKAKMIRNILIVFLLSGLWHGASWNFVIWGAINGLFIIVLDRLLVLKSQKGLKRIAVSLFVTLMWSLSLVFFRAETFQDALTMFGNLFASTGELMLYDFELNEATFKLLFGVIAFYFIFEIVQENRTNLYDWFYRRNVIVRWSVYLFLVAFTLLFGAYGEGVNDANFIYFQF